MFSALLLAYTATLCQADTGKIYNSKFLKRGFYRNYEEFIKNSPSMIEEFSVKPLHTIKDSNIIIAGEYLLKDTLKTMHHVWGFCDGYGIYVNSSPSYTYKYFWKLLSIGKYSCFKGLTSYKGLPLPFPNAIGLDLAFVSTQTIKINPKNLILYVITDNGKFKEPDIGYMKKILAEKPELLKEFRVVADKYEKFDYPDRDQFESEEDYENKISIIVEYLSKLNEALKNKD